MRLRRTALLLFPSYSFSWALLQSCRPTRRFWPGWNGNLVPSHGVLFGIYAKKRGRHTHNQEIRHVERQLHHRFAIDHFYLASTSLWPTRR